MENSSKCMAANSFFSPKSFTGDSTVRSSVFRSPLSFGGVAIGLGIIAVTSKPTFKNNLFLVEFPPTCGSAQECCICLSAYDDGVELRQLPCDHHFHCACIDKWLHINATCPLCKFNIVKSSNSREEV